LPLLRGEDEPFEEATTTGAASSKNYWRTHCFPWSDVEGVGVALQQQGFLLRQRLPSNCEAATRCSRRPRPSVSRSGSNFRRKCSP